MAITLKGGPQDAERGQHEGSTCLTVINVRNDGHVTYVLAHALASDHIDGSSSGRRLSRRRGGGGKSGGPPPALLHVGAATGYFASTPLSCTCESSRTCALSAAICGGACALARFDALCAAPHTSWKQALAYCLCGWCVVWRMVWCTAAGLGHKRRSYVCCHAGHHKQFGMFVVRPYNLN